ncbi:MAG: DUF4350 domain-containing protein, partial [Euryarchaeota archaeon]|nr:DUF4350 domain-containing protein [Euryarchaeota archaeon]
MRYYLVLFILAAGCLGPSGQGERVVFDLSHREAFQPMDVDALGYTTVYGMFKEAGYDTQARTEPITPELLDGTAVLVLAGPLAPLGEEETRAVLDYVRGGGNLLVLIHIAEPVAPLLNELGILSTVQPIVEETDLIGGHQSDFYVTDI